VTRSRAARIATRVVVAALWVPVAVIALAALAELWLAKRSSDRFDVSDYPEFDRLHRAYRPFMVQHLHPKYLFFFALDPDRRDSDNSEICSVDASGFRGGGPEAAGARKLAFLLGGSTAFGHYASSDRTTITGYLNQIQDEYFVVNAGVPSWTSTQELFRLVDQLLAYQPELVISLGGANDLETALDYHRRGLVHEPGTPESFERLHRLVGDIRSGTLRPHPDPWYERAFPRVSRRLRRRSGRRERAEARPSGRFDAMVAENARKYLENMQAMHDVLAFRGDRFIAVLQPMAVLHANVRASRGRSSESEAYRLFRRLVTAGDDGRLSDFLDYSSFFDSRLPEVPVFEEGGARDLAPETIFVDGVHLTDRGNAMIAEALERYLRAAE
jgi:lysophospholipase L1-like esterase